MANTYNKIMTTHNVDILQEISRVLLLIMYALLAKTVNGYHYVRGKYLEYKYASAVVKPTDRYFLSENGREDHFNSFNAVPTDWVYIEEWIDTRGHKKMIALYEGEEVPTHWEVSPFDLPPARCPWVWVGDKETEIDLTRTFDKFLVPGNVITLALVSKLIKITDHTRLIYMESGTLKEVDFPGEGVIIEADVD
jgi:hypothetical protein